MEQVSGRSRRSADDRGWRAPDPIGRDVEGWRSQAACRDVDPNLFFPNGNTGPAIRQIEMAKAFCRSCPVQHECLEFALESNQEDGVWGGKDETERRRLRRDWRQARQLRRRPVGV